MPECPIEAGKSSTRRSECRTAPGRSPPSSSPSQAHRRNTGGCPGARIRPLSIKLIDCFAHPFSSDQFAGGTGAWTAATDGSPARAASPFALRQSLGRCGGRDRRAHRVCREVAERAGQGLRAQLAGRRRLVNAGHHACSRSDRALWTPDIASATSSSRLARRPGIRGEGVTRKHRGRRELRRPEQIRRLSDDHRRLDQRLRFAGQQL
jgi:hypothetical protein